MDTHTLHAFVTVAEQGSFSAAADKLFLTQSAISKRVAQLEEQLGNRLFDRIGRTISLTEAGQALLPRARKILLELDDARRTLGNLSGTVSGTLSLAASHHISLHRLPPILRRFSLDYPSVQLDLRFDESEIAYEGVLRGELELALITLAPHPDRNILSRAVWQDRLCYVASPDHPLANRGRLELDELTDYTAILPGEQTFTRELVGQLFQKRGLSLSVAMSTNYLDTIRMMVSIGLGWSLLPETMLGDDLQVLEVNAEPVYRQLGYIHHRNRTLSNAANRLVELLTAAGSSAN
ncbi:LysR family transcriptional regulator [Marinobacterium arenosum]|uniref:LysR family transcriptional regulator n=1 Tax=Marinobacterium arenosum TaxID=2862496 RepID=UPI001C976DE5|nr:LysR family transcriptional regulator [Marinobacterium arenosum]MBY4675156.1 LysR family transcriptional regulator [Marinobacterium arenosum]